MAWHSLKVLSVQKTTKDAVIIDLDISEYAQEFGFQAGQYVNLQTTINGQDVKRSYSVCTAPSEKRLAVVVKKVENGLFSTFANDILQSGDVLNVHTPEGRFVVPNNSNDNHFVAFAAGSGITPIAAMVKDTLEINTQSKFTLVYGSKSPDEVILKKELEAIQEQFSERFTMHMVYSQYTDSAGRIDTQKINEYFPNGFNDISSVFVCGPEGLIRTVASTCHTSGMAKENIHFELFQAVETPIWESTETNTDSEEVLDGKAHLTVLLDGDTIELDIDADDYILDALIDEGYDPPHSCRGGICSSCVGKVTHGKVEMTDNMILTDGEIEEGQVLTCKGKAVTKKVTLVFE